MPKQSNKHLPAALQRCACVVALLLCLGQAFSSLHVHGSETAEEVCAACALAQPVHPSSSICGVGEPPIRHQPEETPAAPLPPSARPFQIPPCRAPPIS